MGERLISIFDIPREARRALPSRTTTNSRICLGDPSHLRLQPFDSHSRRRPLLCASCQPPAAVREWRDAWLWRNICKECRHGLVWLEVPVSRECRIKVFKRGA